LTTALALSQVSDRGKFERIGIGILRRFSEECSSVLRTGTNALDEPIGSPLDGFCRIPDRDPPCFVLIQCTTTDVPGLRSKWLANGVPKRRNRPGRLQRVEIGDLIKAGQESSKLRIDFPKARFKVHLVVNQPVNHDLYVEVQKVADSLNLGCEIWELTRLADLLDRPEGQIFRRELGIPPRDLSRELLVEIGLFTVKQAETEALTEPRLWVQRAAGSDLQSAIDTGNHGLIVLCANPGRGKSVVGLQTLESHLASGGLALRVDAGRVSDCETLDEAIERTLRTFEPALAPEDGRSFRRLLEPAKPLLVLLEDVNRIDHTSRFLRKIISWCRSPADPHESDHLLKGRRSQGVVVLVPIWPTFRDEITTRLMESPWVTIHELDVMEVAEADEAVRRIFDGHSEAIGSAHRGEIVERLGRDPILIGLLGRLLASNNCADPMALSENVVSHYLDRSIEETFSQSKQSTLIQDDFQRGLNQLAAQIMLHRDLNPSWDTINNWFSNDSRSREVIVALARHGGIVRMAGIGDACRLAFRHDRLMQEVLARFLAREVSRGERPSLLFDPFFADIAGRAITQVATKSDLLNEIARCCPLALFVAIRVMQFRDDSSTRAIIAAAVDWAREKGLAQDILPAVLHSISWSLLTTDSVCVQEIVTLLQYHPLLLLAGLRNGLAEHGVSYLANFPHFHARAGDVQLQRSVEVALTRHPEQLVEGLHRALRDPALSDNKRKGAIELAGYIGNSAFEQDLAICFRGAHDSGLVLVPMLWASLRCIGDAPNISAGPIIEAWRSLPSEAAGRNDRSQRSRVAGSLQMALAKGIPARAVRFLTAIDASVDDDFANHLFLILKYVNDPDAIEYRIRHTASASAADQPARCFLTADEIVGPWDSKGGIPPRRLTEESRTRARLLWSDDRNDERVRFLAFLLWSSQSTANDLAMLQTIEPLSPWHREALRRRAQLGDTSCVTQLVETIRRDPWSFELAPKFWCEELRSLTDE
jgi:hypothetical protein